MQLDQRDYGLPSAVGLKPSFWLDLKGLSPTNRTICCILCQDSVHSPGAVFGKSASEARPCSENPCKAKVKSEVWMEHLSTIVRAIILKSRKQQILTKMWRTLIYG